MAPTLIEGASAVLDACVLVPMPLCDTLLRCAEEPPLYRPLWSEETLIEVERTMLKLGFSAAQAGRRIQAMRSAFPFATIQANPESIVNFPKTPDPGDRHVVAAAINARAETLVTLNLRHFPQDKLKALGILVQSPDEFLIGLYNVSPDRLLAVMEAQKSVCRETQMDLHARLRKTAPRFVELVSKAR